MGRVVYVTISSGQTVSDNLACPAGERLHSVFVPALPASADLMVQGYFDNVTSANFTRVQRIQPNTGDVRFATGPGSKMIYTLEDVPDVPYLRFEASVAQTGPTSLACLFRLR